MFEPQIDLTGKLIIKVKLGDDIRRILITNEDITYDELVLMMQRVYRGKLNSTDDIVIKYKDEDSDLITIFDSSDLTFAIQCSRILNITLFVNGKPEPLQTNEVKHIKKELRHIRDTCNRLLDKLDEREPQPTSEAVVDSSTSKVPSQIVSIPDNTRKRPSPSTDVQAVSQPSSKEFDPLSTQKAMDVDHQQNKVISSFGLSNDTGGTVERAGTPDSVSSIGSSASNKGRLQPQQPQQPQKPSESPSHSPYQQPGSQPTSQPGTPAHPGSQSMYGGQGPPSGQKIPPWQQQQQPQQPQQQQQSPVQPAQQIGGQYPAQQVPSGSTAGQVSASGFPPGSQHQGFPPSSQGQPTQAGFGQQQQPTTSQYPGYGQGQQTGTQGQQQMYQPPVQYNPQMGNQPGQPSQQQPQQQPHQPQQYGYSQPSQPSQQPAGPGQGPPAPQGPPGSNPYARGQGTGGYTAGYPRPAGNYPTGYQ